MRLIESVITFDLQSVYSIKQKWQKMFTCINFWGGFWHKKLGFAMIIAIMGEWSAALLLDPDDLKPFQKLSRSEWVLFLLQLRLSQVFTTIHSVWRNLFILISTMEYFGSEQ